MTMALKFVKYFSLTPIVINRKAYKNGLTNEEYLYHAGQHANQDLNLFEINAQIKNTTMLLTAILGEMWYSEKWYGERLEM